MNTLEQIWAIRDARSLDTYEKNFLFIVASRGEAGMFCEWKRNSEDMGMKKDRYYKSRASLVDKGLISAHEQSYGPTIYKINNDVLAAWHSATQNGDSVTQNAHSATQNGRSVTPERKRNTKINNKKNIKKNTTSPSAGAVPAPVLEEIEKDKESSESSPIVEVLPILEETPAEPASPIEGTDMAHSVTQNEEDYYEWNGRKIKKAGVGDPFEGATVVAEPIEEAPKIPCDNCGEILDRGLCWNVAC